MLRDPKKLLFFYLRLRSALKAYKVPWGTDLICHPVVDWIVEADPKGKASYIYTHLMTYSTVFFPGSKLWEKDLEQRGGTINWDMVWKSIPGVSKNPNHQFIHFKICHRVYMTPRKRHLMGLAPHPWCTYCTPGTIGTLMHVLWDCPEVQRFWAQIVDITSFIIGKPLHLWILSCYF